MANHTSIDYGLYESVVRMQELLMRSGCANTSECEALKDITALIASKTYVLAVMGEFKRGKSSLINALLGSPILPADVEPTTATLNRIVFATRPQVTVTYVDGTTVQVPIDELSAYVTKQGLDDGADATSIVEVVIGHPAPLTQNHIEIYDTPGLNDDKRMTQIAIQMVEKADMVLVPIHARFPYSQTEQEFVCQLIRNEDIDHIMFVVTFIDMLGEEGFDYNYKRFMYGHGGIRQRIQMLTFERLKDDPTALTRAHEMLDDLNLCAVSAKQALDAYATGNAELLASSRMDEFRNQLLTTLTSRQTIATANKVRKEIDRGVSLIRSVGERRLEMLTQEAEAIDEALVRMENYPQTMRRQLNRFFADVYEHEKRIVGEIQGLTTTIAQCYIEQLSMLRVLNPLALRNALARGDAARVQVVPASIEQTERTLGRLYGEVENVVLRSEETMTASISTIPGRLLMADDEQILQIPRTSASNALTSVTLDWHDPFAAMSDYELARTNPIAHVHKEAARSVEKLQKDFASACNQVRAAYLGRLVSHAKMLCEWAQEHEGGIRRIAEQRLQAAREEEADVQAAATEIICAVNELIDSLD